MYILREKAEKTLIKSQPGLFINYHKFGSRERDVVSNSMKHVSYGTAARM